MPKGPAPQEMANSAPGIRSREVRQAEEVGRGLPAGLRGTVRNADVVLRAKGSCGRLK